jgi:solute carrier family 25 thiamine pyrophosphate transporter 19
MQVYRGMLDATRDICAQKGVRGLYRGLGVTLVEIVPYASLQFGLYDAFNQAWDRFKVGSARCLLGL